MPEQNGSPRESAELTVRTPDDAEVATLYPDDEGAHGLLSEVYGENSFTAMPRGTVERLNELKGLIEADTTVTLARDWEGCVWAPVKGDPRLESLYFTDDGRVGHGGVNQPLYFDSFANLLGGRASSRGG